VSTLVTGFNITSDQMRSRVDIVVSRNVKGGRLPSPPVEDLPDDYREALLNWLLPGLVACGFSGTAGWHHLIASAVRSDQALDHENP
jgi:hypothetical protein